MGGASGAIAAEEYPPAGTVIIDGHEFGPEDGLVVSTESFEVPSDGTVVGATLQDSKGGISTNSIWGASYAYSWSANDIVYQGAAKAAANVYGGLRIIQVCFWWTRGGTKVSSTYCANASFSGGSWHASAETTGTTTDTLDPNAPVTYFNVSWVRIDPQTNY